MKPVHVRGLGLVLVLVLGLFFLPRREHWESYDGETMGTTFHILWSSDERAGRADRIRSGIDRILEQVNDQMSTYRTDSEIQRFAESPPKSWFQVSPETRSVVAGALELAELTGGAFDPTIAPLVELWGFGPPGRRHEPPDSSEIAEATARVGWRQVETREEPAAIRRSAATATLDLSAIAKGHGVDRLARYLEGNGVERYLIEIGGEVRVLGAGPGGPGWTIELEWPDGPLPDRVTRQDSGSTSRDPHRLVLSSGALATSGTYRNLFRAEGLDFHHVLDPRTGRPADHATVQVTVIAENCQMADGRATALLVLGDEEGMRLAEELGWAARFLLVVATESAGESRQFDWTEVTTTEFARLVDQSGTGDAEPRRP